MAMKMSKIAQYRWSIHSHTTWASPPPSLLSSHKNAMTDEGCLGIEIRKPAKLGTTSPAKETVQTWLNVVLEAAVELHCQG
mmetsp:Transcript_63918/g.106749  ORF Transcript_63918/g.106749 Transcript_63918/m.106749 type:complete len:81 (-) Transcript_63918:474-716(-)